jgi:L-asparaginase
MIVNTHGTDTMVEAARAPAFAQILPPGVYLAMNGRCFDWDNVRKNKKIGEFEDIR